MGQPEIETTSQRLQRVDAQLTGLLAVILRLLAALPVDVRAEVDAQIAADLEGLHSMMLFAGEPESDHALRGLEYLRQVLRANRGAAGAATPGERGEA